MIYVMSGGGTKLFAAIGVTYPVGSTLICTNGTKTLTAKNTSGQWVFAIPEAGTWTVTSTDGTNTKSQSVSITKEGQWESVELSYRYYLFKEGSGAQNGFTFNATNPGVFSISNSKITFNTNIALSNVVSVTPTIDLSAYSVLNFELKCTGRYGGSGGGYDVTFGVGSNAPTNDSNPGSWTAKLADIYDESRKNHSVDVSSVSSAQYVKFWAYATTGEIYNIWLE